MHVLNCSYEPGSGLTVGPVFGLALSHLHLHHAGQYGLAFPDARPGKAREFRDPLKSTTGDRLQIFGQPEVLEAIRRNLIPMADYLFVSKVQPVRGATRHLVVRRVQNSVKTPASMARELRRAVRRAEERGRPLDAETLAHREAGIAACSKDVPADHLPFIHARSLSTNARFTIQFATEIVDTEVVGSFDSYGFSKDGTTVPMV